MWWWASPRGQWHQTATCSSLPTLYPPPKLPERLNQTEIEKLSARGWFSRQKRGRRDARRPLPIEPRDVPIPPEKRSNVLPRCLSFNVQKLSKIFRHFFFFCAIQKIKRLSRQRWTTKNWVNPCFQGPRRSFCVRQMIWLLSLIKVNDTPQKFVVC